VRVSSACDWLPAREAARIGLGWVFPAVTGEKLAADRKRRVFARRKWRLNSFSSQGQNCYNILESHKIPNFVVKKY
jgi:hypothetical protein